MRKAYLMLRAVRFAMPIPRGIRGALLPHHFTLTLIPERKRRYLSVALSITQVFIPMCLAVSQHRLSITSGLSSAVLNPKILIPQSSNPLVAQSIRVYCD